MSAVFGVRLRHGHGSFNGRRDPKSSKPTPGNPGHISLHPDQDGSTSLSSATPRCGGNRPTGHSWSQPEGDRCTTSQTDHHHREHRCRRRIPARIQQVGATLLDATPRTTESAYGSDRTATGFPPERLDAAADARRYAARRAERETGSGASRQGGQTDTAGSFGFPAARRWLFGSRPNGRVDELPARRRRKLLNCRVVQRSLS